MAPPWAANSASKLIHQRTLPGARVARAAATGCTAPSRRRCRACQAGMPGLPPPSPRLQFSAPSRVALPASPVLCPSPRRRCTMPTHLHHGIRGPLARLATAHLARLHRSSLARQPSPPFSRKFHLVCSNQRPSSGPVRRLNPAPRPQAPSSPCVAPPTRVRCKHAPVRACVAL